MPLIRYCFWRQYAKNHTQQGFSLPEALIAALFFSVSLLGLLQYHQALLQGFSSLWQQRQAWSLLNQYIDSGGDKPAKALTSGIKPHWQYHQFIKRIDGECTEFTFILRIQPKQQAELSRWFCNTSEGS
ncbi:TPA: peptidase [Yersinia enterocolitica]|nr:peptidase [Yersinia enterocolitica]HDM8384330.1 peptidase [Yersinia enterocolitica]